MIFHRENTNNTDSRGIAECPFRLILFAIMMLPLSLSAQKPELVLPIGHIDKVYPAVFSPDGRFILTASRDHTAKLWETQSGKLLQTLEGHTDFVISAVFSTDGKYILTASDDNTAKLWEPQSGKLLQNLEGHTGFVIPAVFSTDGKYILTASDDNTAKLWEPQSGKLLQTLEGHKSVTSAVFSPDGKYILTASWDNTAKLWETQSGTLLQTFEGHSSFVSSAAFSPDGRYIVTASWDNTAKIWETQSGKLLQTLEGHTAGVTSAVFSPDRKYIVTASWDNTAKLWETQSGKLLQTLEGHTARVISAVFSPDGRSILTVSSDSTAKLWETQSGKFLQTFEGHKLWVASAVFSRDGKSILTACFDSTAKLWETQSGKFLQTFEGHKLWVTSAVFSPDGRSFLTASNDKANLWETQSGKLLQTIEGHKGSLVSAVFSPDGRSILTASEDHTAKLWETQSGKLLQNLEGYTGKISSAIFSPDGRYILRVSRDTVKLWETQSGNLLQTFEGDTLFVISAAFSPDGRSILTTGSDTRAKLWETQSGKLLQTFEGHTGGVESAVFSPDGQSILTANWDYTAKLWETQSGKLLKTLEGHDNEIFLAVFSPDGRYILTASRDHTAKLWETQSGNLLQTLYGHTDGVESAVFSPDGQSILTASWDHTAKLWETQSGKLINTIDGETEDITSPFFSPDGKYILSRSGASKLKFWDVLTGKELFTFIPVDKEDWVVINPEGLFDASEGAMKLMYYVKGLEIIELNQLKARYWEPGLYEKIMSGKPLRDVRGMDQLKLQPEIQLGEVRDGKLDIQLTKRDGGYGKVTVLINGKELLADARGQGFDTTKATQSVHIDLKEHPYLLAGKENTITVKASSADGFVQSRGVEVLYVPEAKKQVVPPSFYAIICGTNQYANPVITLRYSVQDAKSMEKAVEIAAGKLFGPERTHVYLLTSPGEISPTRDNIQKTVKEIAFKAKAEDILLVYLSGHGITWGGQSGDFYYLTPDAFSSSSESFSDPAIRAKTTISTAEFVEMIKTIPALKEVMIIDACGAGKAVENLVAMREIDASQIKALDMMKDRLGLWVLGGCAADAQSYEATSFGQGLLTYSLLQAMKGAALKDNRFVDVSTLFEYASARVPELANGIGGIQKPQLLPGKSGSFPIGDLPDDKAREQIPLANTKPVFVQCNIQDEDAFEDVLGIGKVLDDRLYDLSARGSESRIAFFRVNEFSNACKISGRYKQTKGRIRFTGKIKCGNQIYPLQTDAGTKEELADKIAQEAVKTK